MRTSRAGESALLLLDVVDRLVAEKIQYAVIGALAASVHGAVRASLDLDPQAFSRVVEVPFQGSTLRFIGREDLIAMKAFAGAPTDLADAARAIRRRSAFARSGFASPAGQWVWSGRLEEPGIAAGFLFLIRQLALCAPAAESVQTAGFGRNQRRITNCLAAQTRATWLCMARPVTRSNNSSCTCHPAPACLRMRRA